MTFGTEWGFGSDAATARAVFVRYLEAGGNFVDTADGYTNGHSEELLGQFIAETGSRDRVVLATKFTFNSDPANPNGGGNGRKNIYRALEGSLRRLKTDTIDLYWLHVWDGVTPLAEVVATLSDLVKAGKIRHYGLSDTPAWYLTRAETVAELRGLEPVAALQLEYSLIERNIEREHVPAALAMNIGICPWSPLGSGLLSGKYRRSGTSGEGEGRLQTMKSSTNAVFQKFTPRNWQVVEVLQEVAAKVERPAAQVALNWITKRPAVTSSIIGATSVRQLDENLGALDFEIPAELSAKLDAVSRPELVFPYTFFHPSRLALVTGGMQIAAEPPWFRER
ncbi:MAG: aldo/keto reductase [Deltaproteobacteria bacterium]|nr:aldo/keto reductase [Deltaproteobacteria bacterium]